ncbi:MAG: uroporphyrinogen-III C-methyltransferase [Synechococcales cyanobacterium CRU_2_2]|nr:uroporphyrinogen-III C-methyltransferase [Synechococcales cyanobacterium CRU_2_2]
MEQTPTAALTDNPSSGRVYLLGAGPGSVDYLTQQARDCLRDCDVLVYDALTDERLRSHLLPHCHLINVGKRGGEPSTPQAKINQILIAQCQQGHQVVRLKSGDPFIFGRATAEIQALKAADCDFEVIPGLSSALVAPLLAGIPLTDPVMSNGFGVFTAHDLDALNWEALAQLPTLVLLMGGRNLDAICQRLLTRGRSPFTPMAIIRWASQGNQRIWTATLRDMPERVQGEPLSPCVIVVGEVVSLREFLR